MEGEEKVAVDARSWMFRKQVAGFSFSAILHPCHLQYHGSLGIVYIDLFIVLKSNINKNDAVSPYVCVYSRLMNAKANYLPYRYIVVEAR